MTKRSEPPRLDGESEDDYYMRLIQDLANEKLALFARLQEEERTAITNLQSLKKSKKREREIVLKEEEEIDDAIDIEIIKTKKGMKKHQKKKVGPTKKTDRRPLVVNEVTERLKELIMNEIKGSEIKLVIQKALTASDLNQGQNRLNMPVNQLETNDFLTPKEIETLENNKKDKSKSVVKVGMLGPNLRMYDKMLELKIWDMPCTRNYVLIGNWHGFVKQHHKLLKQHTLIQVWSFRINKQLCLAIVCPDNNNDVAFVEEMHHDGENGDVVAAAIEV